MKVAFDTSVLVAALVTAHPRHADAIGWLRAEDDELERIASWHAYAETWSVLTAMPLRPRVTGATAQAALDRARTRLRMVLPRATTYAGAARRCTERGIRSGAVYDALHLLTAEAESAEVLLTFNPRDFERLTQPDGPRIVVPGPR